GPRHWAGSDSVQAHPMPCAIHTDGTSGRGRTGVQRAGRRRIAWRV
ncbi:MAG: hypothetical protein AVDCRST_MAG71-347, partial [uncultured Lysobacter sp.]